VPIIRVLALKPYATQLLSHLGSWSVVHPASARKLKELFK